MALLPGWNAAREQGGRRATTQDLSHANRRNGQGFRTRCAVYFQPGFARRPENRGDDEGRKSETQGRICRTASDRRAREGATQFRGRLRGAARVRSPSCRLCYWNAARTVAGCELQEQGNRRAQSRGPGNRESG